MNKKSIKTSSNNTVFYQHYENNKDAKTLFFIHGFPDTPEVWQNQFDFFKSEYNIMAPYNPSTHDFESNYSLSEICRDYISIIKHHECADVILVSHDIGGPIASALVDQLSNIKRSIQINAPSLEQMNFRLKDIKQLQKSWYIFLFQSSLLTKAFLKTKWNWIINKIISENKLPTSHKINKEVFTRDIKLYKLFFKQVMSISNKQPNLIQTQTDFIWSKNDPYLNIPSKEELELLYKNYSLEIIDAYHWPMIEQSQLINEKIRNLL